MKVRFGSYCPFKADGVRSYTLFILPELSLFYLNGVQTVSLAWLFWDVTFDLGE